MNKAWFIGNLTRDPDYKSTPEGKSVCKFTIAVTRDFKNKDGAYDADFLNIVVWGAQAEACSKYLNKGKKVAVCGSVRTGSYEAQDGTKRYTFDIWAENVKFLFAKEDTNSDSKPPYQKPEVSKPSKPSKPVQPEVDDGYDASDDDMPF